ncbi:MAG: hypothetical protein FWD61_05675 [Phycisphaerales bacterium]|nr:hypothetical protein [Phycisphaerales bacterium]
MIYCRSEKGVGFAILGLMLVSLLAPVARADEESAIKDLKNSIKPFSSDPAAPIKDFHFTLTYENHTVMVAHSQGSTAVLVLSTEEGLPILYATEEARQLINANTMDVISEVLRAAAAQKDNNNVSSMIDAISPLGMTAFISPSMARSVKKK